MPIRSQAEFDLHVRLELAGVLECPERWRGAVHRHVFWEILYIREGACAVTVGGRQWELSAGHSILIQPLEEHLFEARGENTRLVYIGFRCEADGDAWPETDAGERLSLDHIQNSQSLMRIMNGIGANTEISEYGEKLLSGLVPVAEWIRRLSGRRGNADAPRRSMLSMKTVKYIRANMNRFISVGEIAASLYVAPHYLGMVFSADMGQTILQYQQAMKMERAAMLIRAGALSLTDISAQLGFSSPQYFSKCFRRYYGFAPKQMKAGKT